MRKYYSDFNEEYERGYEDGRRAGLRSLDESSSVKAYYTIFANTNPEDEKLYFVYKTLKSLEKDLDGFVEQGFDINGYIIKITSGIEMSDLKSPEDNRYSLKKPKFFNELEYQIIRKY